MAEQATISLRYQLKLEEFQEAFRIASFGQKGIMAWMTTIIATLLMLWGFKIGFDNGGKYYIIFGAIFSIMQLIIRFYFMPQIFKRQFLKMQLDKKMQGIDLYQKNFYLANDKGQYYAYPDVKKTAEGQLCYVLELKNHIAVIVPKRELTAEQQAIFKQQFKMK